MKTKLMRHLPLLLAFSLIATFVTPSFSAESTDLGEHLRDGLFEEEANRDLAAAIKAYEIVLKQFDANRQFASTAIFRLGECHRKQGKPKEAAVYYRRILRDFSDQTNLVELATRHLKEAGEVPLTKAPAPDTAPRQSVFAGLRAELVDLDVRIERLNLLKQQGLYQSIALLLNDDKLATLFEDYSKARTEAAANLKAMTAEHPKVKAAKVKEERTFQQLHEHIADVIQGLEIGRVVVKKKLAEQELLEREGLPAVIDSRYRPANAEEAKELARVQRLAKDSPDKINRSSGDSVPPPLHDAARNGHMAVAAYLLDNGADIQNEFRDFGQPLQNAIAAGHMAMSKLLLDRGAEINPDTRYSPLNIAIAHRYENLCKLLLDKGAAVKSSNRYGWTPLHFACYFGMSDIAKRLIQNGADVNAKTSPIPGTSNSRMGTRLSRLTTKSRLMPSFPVYRMLTPLHLAAAKGRLEIVKALIAKGAKVDVQDQAGRSPLYDALHDVEMTRLLLKSGADPNHKLVGDNGAVIILAVENNHLDSLKALIEAGANLATDGGHSPLQTALDTDNTAAVKLLLKSGAHPTTRFRNRPMIDYAWRKSADTLAALLEAGADPNASNERLLVETINHGLIHNLRLMLKHKANPDGITRKDHPIFYATPHFRFEPTSPDFLDALIEHGANVNVQDDQGMTALSRCVSTGQKEYVQRLLLAGADPDLADSQGNTPLHHAVNGGSREILKLLLEHKANPNRLNNEGNSPLDMVAKPAGHTPTTSSFQSRLIRLNELKGIPPPAQLTATQRNAFDKLLRSHGALEDLARENHITAVRPSSGSKARVFQKSVHSSNQHTLTEFIHRALTPDDADTSNIHRNPFAFPDLTRVTIRRREGEKESSTTVNFLDHLRSDTSAPIHLHWGDIVEIPERPHPVDDRWRGADKLVSQRMHEKLHRRVKIRAGGATQEFALLPFRLPDSRGNESPESAAVATLLDSLGVYRHAVSKPTSRTMQRILAAYQERLAKSGKDSETVDKASLAPYLRGFWLRQTLKDSRRLLSTSDTGSIKIHRKTRDGKTTTLEFNLDDMDSGDIWLLNGDLIEIPDRN